MHGKGTYKWEDGRVYQGEYQFDKKHGRGIYQWPNGRVFEGTWVNGKREGIGKIKEDSSSEWVEGEWRNDERVRK